LSDTFEICNCMVKLGGDALNTVAVYNVTPAEIAVLQMIHTPEAVHDIRPLGTTQRTHRIERERLLVKYPSAKDKDGASHVERLFPGAAARVFSNLDDLSLSDTQFWREPVRRGNDTSRKSAQALQEDAAALAAPGAQVVLDDDAGSSEAVRNGPEAEIDAEDVAGGLRDLPADPPAPSTFE
jgi:hypothetical protein